MSWVRLRVCWLICWFLGSANQKFKPRGRSWKRGEWEGERGGDIQCKCNEIKYNKANKKSTADSSKVQPQNASRNLSSVSPSASFPKSLEASTSGVRSRVLRGVAREWRTIMQQNPLEALPEPALPSDSNDASNDIVKSEACAAVPSQRSRRLDRRR